MKNKNIIGLTAMSAILVSAVFASSIALANEYPRGNYEKCGSCNDKRCDDKKCDKCDDKHCDECDKNECSYDPVTSGPFSPQFRGIAENGDYKSWRYIMWRYGYLGNFRAINERNFSRFIQAMRCLDRGDMSGAETILRKIDKKLPTYFRGFRAGFIAGYQKGWKDARDYYTCGNEGGQCDVRVDIYNAGY